MRSIAQFLRRESSLRLLLASLAQLWLAGSVQAGINEWTYVGLAPERVTDNVVHPSDPDIIYVSALDVFWDDTREGGLFKTTDHGQTWDTLGFRHSNVFDVDIDRVHPETLWVADGLAGVFRSFDGGVSWENRSNGLPLGGADNLSAFAVAVNPANALEIITSATGDMGPGWTYKSSDGGQSWFNVDPWLTLMRIVFDSLVTGRVYASSYNREGVQISDDYGNTFRRTPNIDAVTDIAPDPFQPNGIWILRIQNFIYTPDTGATWIEPDTTFPPELGGGQVVVASPVNDDEVCVAITTHVYRSTSGGTSWSELNSGLPATQINVLSLVALSTPEYWLSTSLGGIYAYAVIDTLSAREGATVAATDRPIVYPNPARGQLFIGGLHGEQFSMSLYNLLGRRVAMMPMHPAGSSHMVSLPSALPNGIYFGIVYQSQQRQTRITFTISK